MDTTPQLAPGIHFDVKDADYRSDPGLNQSRVKSFMAAPSPFHFKYEEDHPPEKSEAMKLGSAVDCLVSNATSFQERFATWEGGRRQGREWESFQAGQGGKEILTIAERDRVRGMVNALERNEDARRIIQNSRRQVVAIAEHPSIAFRMKALIDLFPDVNTEWLFDLKTSAGADCDTFHEQCFRLNYAMQARWYMDACRFAGVHVQSFGFVVVENEPPHGVQIHYYDYEDEVVQRAGLQYAAAVPKLLEFQRTGVWPGYDSAWRKVTPKPWMLKDKPEPETEALI